MIEIYCDGSSTPNRSGWGFVALRDKTLVHQESGTCEKGTNQEMELRAVQNACYWGIHNRIVQPFEREPVTIYSDSAYVINCYIQKWWRLWEDNGWCNSKGEEVANKEIWWDVIRYFKEPFFDFKHVKGHSGHTFNEMADKLAKGTLKPSANLTNNKKKDKITIELSELMLEYRMKKISTEVVINKIYEIMEKNQ